MSKKLKVAVLMGGNSSEKEVSLMSGREIINNLDKNKYEVVKINVPDELEKVKGCDLAFVALHGKGGEDGQIQGYLEMNGVKYTGCGVLASAIGMNKLIFRWLLERFNLPMPKLTEKIPCVVKPVDAGSSVGVTIVKKQSQLVKAIKEAKKFGSEVLVEEYLEGREFSCGILGDLVLPPIEIKPKKDFFDFEAKYNEKMCVEICPAKISKSLNDKIQELTKEVFTLIKGKGCARVDFIVKANKPYILEINTLPGMTEFSLLPKEAAVLGISYPKLLDKIIKIALE